MVNHILQKIKSDMPDFGTVKLDFALGHVFMAPSFRTYRT